MSLEAILAEIEAATEAQIAELGQHTEAEVQTILDEARREAETGYEMARLAVLEPVAVIKAQRLYEARLAAERATAVTRSALQQKIERQAQQYLWELRHEPAYGSVLRGLIEEGLEALGGEEAARLVIDGRDQALVADILGEMEAGLPVEATLKSWGGVVVQSEDGRITINNSLESRLERAMAYVEF
jgi:V/A-type H+-transporting ATPase subunit E